MATKVDEHARFVERMVEVKRGLRGWVGYPESHRTFGVSRDMFIRVAAILHLRTETHGRYGLVAVK